MTKKAEMELCSKNKDKKSESNSQLVLSLPYGFNCCVRRTKIKNLKAIHNVVSKVSHAFLVVFEEHT